MNDRKHVSTQVHEKKIFFRKIIKKRNNLQKMKIQVHQKSKIQFKKLLTFQKNRVFHSLSARLQTFTDFL